MKTFRQKQQDGVMMVVLPCGPGSLADGWMDFPLQALIGQMAQWSSLDDLEFQKMDG